MAASASAALDSGSLSLLPFAALGSLYGRCPWSGGQGRSVRATSLELGIPDLLLVCLAAFSHQQARQTAEPASWPESVRMVDQLLGNRDSSTNMVAAIASQSASLASASASASISAEERAAQQYWAKGTGFGTGSTQQQWNMDLHVLKRKQDEENVTCLLNVRLNQCEHTG